MMLLSVLHAKRQNDIIPWQKKTENDEKENEHNLMTHKKRKNIKMKSSAPYRDRKIEFVSSPLALPD
jgi:hypothetical protein